MAAAMTQTIDGIEVPGKGIWEFDTHHTLLTWVARYLMVTKVHGIFKVFSGRIVVGDTVEDSSVEVEIDAASIDSNAPDRDNHLRSADFLDVENYPKLTFKSTKVERTGDNSLRVTGDFTVRDVTKPIVLDVEYEGLQIDPFGRTKAAFSASGEIDRDDWGVSWNMALEKGGWLVSKKIQLELDVLAVAQTDEAESTGSADTTESAEAAEAGTGS